MQLKVRIILNKRIRGNYFHLIINAPRMIKGASPGQFVNIKINDDYEPLLRRPFSIHLAKGNTLEILYEVLGKATEILSQKKSKEYLDIIGPLGKEFDLNKKADKRAVIVAGGMGVVPLFFLAEKLAKSKSIVLIGAKTKNQILCKKDFQDLGCDVKIATDDGSYGFKGKVTDLLNNLLSTVNCKQLTIYACGPRPMLKEISLISKRHGIAAQISLEEHMACGIGACLGCVVNTKQGFQRVCKEGPVFRADEIVW